ncbi:hypothetical protein [Brevibacillus borstelensis]|uniref:hypothetical protein n=1 Tax=Brevibacillus borstelensis TaxID=45462 RepID=UPI0030C0C822
MSKIIEGLAITTIFYFATLWSAFTLFHFIYRIPFDHEWDLSGNFVGMFMITIPYILYGLVMRVRQDRPVRQAFIVSLITVVCERVSIYALGVFFSSNGYGSPVPLQFIRGEAAPYFTPLYIFAGGIVSVSLCVITTGIRRRKPLPSS